MMIPEPEPKTVIAIYEAYERDQESGYRYHLGASLIGTECERSLWYSFRWATRSYFEGRMLRLFQTGHLAEYRFIADLRKVGVIVHEYEDVDHSRYAEDYDRPSKQISVRDSFGHFGGSLDGEGIGFLEAPKTWHVVEFKTHSEKSFNKLKLEGVRKSKPRHFAQMQVYMHLRGLTRAFYMAVNKNTDELYSERVHYDAEFALRLLSKADRIVKALEPPRKISNDPSWEGCKGYSKGAYRCDHYDVCHGGTYPERHCRSCLHATPEDGGWWSCAQGVDGSGGLSRERQEAGCELHRYIPELVHGEFLGVTEPVPGNWLVSYLMGDGSEWVDGAMAGELVE